MALFNSSENRKPGFKLALLGSVFAVFVLGLGAFTRLVDAGLGCPDWPTCYGHILWPNSTEEIVKANQAYPDMPVDVAKTWPEMVHRYFASSLGLITIALYVIALRHRNEWQPTKITNTLLSAGVLLTATCVVIGPEMEPYAAAAIGLTMLVLLYFALTKGSSKHPYKLPAFLLAFIILQGLFGMWTVTLKLWPQVVTLHLLGGFATLSLLWLLTLRLNNDYWRVSPAIYESINAMRRPALLGLLIVIVQVMLGGWTTSNYAAVACPDLPTCQAQWIPPMDFAEGFNIFQGIGPNYLGGIMDNEARIAIHMSHRIGAIITTVYLLILSWMLIRTVAVAETRRMGLIILSVLILQVALGLGNIYFHFPLYTTVSHNLGGALLLLTQVTLLHRIYTVQLRP